MSILPKDHIAGVRARYKASPETIYAAITDVARGADWRTGLKNVTVLQTKPLKWVEDAKWGKITMVMDEATSPKKVVTRIADTSQGFGGTWTFEIAPDGTGSIVTITEIGEVYNLFFRFMSKFVFGYYRALEGYASDLGRRFGESAQVERLK